MIAKRIILYVAPLLMVFGCFVVAERDKPIVRQFDQYVLCLTRELNNPGSAFSARAARPRPSSAALPRNNAFLEFLGCAFRQTRLYLVNHSQRRPPLA